MKRIMPFLLVNETATKDNTGQTIPNECPDTTELIGELKSVYQNEFYKAEQAGIRPQGVFVISSFDYNGQDSLIIGSKSYAIYRTFEVGTDKIELYFGDRVGGSNG